MNIREKTAGIIGGMGPEATVDLMRRIIRLTPALADKDHIRCLVDNNPKIPSRITACTELSTLGRETGKAASLVCLDAAEILAKRIVDVAKGVKPL